MFVGEAGDSCRKHTCLRLFLGWCFPIEHLLLRDLQQVTAILRQQIEGVGDVGDVFDVGLFEAEAVEGFQQVAGGAQALDGAFEDVLRVGRCVDDQGLGVGEVGFEGAVAIGGELIPSCHVLILNCFERSHRIVTKRQEATVFGLVNR